MKILTVRSAVLATCATLLVAGTAVQASANDTDHSNGYDITVNGNHNNTAGNDLSIGNNNTMGTGHTMTTLQAQDVNQSGLIVYVRNNTDTDLQCAAPGSPAGTCQAAGANSGYVVYPTPIPAHTQGAYSAVGLLSTETIVSYTNLSETAGVTFYATAELDGPSYRCDIDATLGTCSAQVLASGSGGEQAQILFTVNPPS
ncbi:hypothetical protein ACFV16_25385 [Streptomyces massasporeus]|uniref:hypothetical protein n=1 Tax=Streptomyces massasporeus TaxID=67324 RepID=UPI003674CD67